MKCPFEQKPDATKCNNRDCVFASLINKSNCFYGEPIDVSNVAYHKKMSVKQLKAHLALVDDQVTYAVKLFKYAEFCGEENPTEQDVRLFASLQHTKPYNSRLFNFVDLRRFARMNRAEAFEAFRKSGVVLEESLRDFIMKPLTPLERR